MKYWRIVLAVVIVGSYLLLPLLVYGQDPGNMTTGLVSCWDLEEASGTREDAYGTNDLTDDNTVGNAAGVVNNAASFIASNLEYLIVASNSGLQAGDIDFSIAGWIYLTDKSTSRPLLSKWLIPSGDREYRLFYLQSSDRFAFSVRNESNTSTGTVEANVLGSPSLNTWYFLVAWHDATNNTINIQVNNGTANSAAWSSGIRTSTSSLLIGRLTDGSNFYQDGRIDTTIIAKTLWTSDQRTWLYNSGGGRSCQDLITTSYTPTPSNTPTATSTATPPHTPTVTPTPTPSPGPKVYTVDLPEGGEAHVVFDLTAGELIITIALLAVVALLAFRQLVDLAWINAKR